LTRIKDAFSALATRKEHISFNTPEDRGGNAIFRSKSELLPQNCRFTNNQIVLLSKRGTEG
jgi:hypothetical protein